MCLCAMLRFNPEEIERLEWCFYYQMLWRMWILNRKDRHVVNTSFQGKAHYRNVQNVPNEESRIVLYIYGTVP